MLPQKLATRSPGKSPTAPHRIRPTQRVPPGLRARDGFEYATGPCVLTGHAELSES